jgi:hypothetical protein
VSVLCVGAAVDVTTEVTWLLTEPELGIVVPAVEDIEVVPGADVGFPARVRVVVDALSVVGLVD